jgi:hypothetical protein
MTYCLRVKFDCACWQEQTSKQRRRSGRRSPRVHGRVTHNRDAVGPPRSYPNFEADRSKSTRTNTSGAENGVGSGSDVDVAVRLSCLLVHMNKDGLVCVDGLCIVADGASLTENRVQCMGLSRLWKHCPLYENLASQLIIRVS